MNYGKPLQKSLACEKQLFSAVIISSHFFINFLYILMMFFSSPDPPTSLPTQLCFLFHKTNKPKNQTNQSSTHTQNKNQTDKNLGKTKTKSLQKYYWLHFVLANYSWASGLPEVWLAHTVTLHWRQPFSFASEYQLQLASCLAVKCIYYFSDKRTAEEMQTLRRAQS